MASGTVQPLPKTAIPLPMREIEAFCRKWGVTRLSLFGSVLRPDFSDASDVDMIVQFAPDQSPTLLTLSRMTGELEQLLQREVDLLDSNAVEQMDNPFLRQSIRESEQVIYAG